MADHPFTNLITIKYSCDLCKLHRVDLQVPARDHDEDVVAYMENLTVLVCIDHDRRLADRQR